MKRKTRTALSIIGPDASARASTAKRYFTIPELTKLSGLSRRQVDYWVKLELITPTIQNARTRGGGKPASFFSRTEALKLLIFSDVNRRGFSVQQIRHLYRNIQHSRVRLDEIGSYLLTDSVTILYAKDNNEAIDLLKHNRQMLLIPLKDQLEKLEQVA